METCIVIAKLIGIFNSEPVTFYNLDCFTSSHSVILKDGEFKEVKAEKLNHKNGIYILKEIK